MIGTGFEWWRLHQEPNSSEYLFSLRKPGCLQRPAKKLAQERAEAARSALKQLSRPFLQRATSPFEHRLDSPELSGSILLTWARKLIGNLAERPKTRRLLEHTSKILIWVPIDSRIPLRSSASFLERKNLVSSFLLFARSQVFWICLRCLRPFLFQRDSW